MPPKRRHIALRNFPRALCITRPLHRPTHSTHRTGAVLKLQNGARQRWFDGVAWSVGVKIQHLGCVYNGVRQLASRPGSGWGG